MQTHVSIPSDGLELAAVLHVPDGAQGGLPAIVVMHGFGGNKDGETHLIEALMYENLGYVVLRFDMRGCGESDGVPGRIICQDQLADMLAPLCFYRGFIQRRAGQEAHEAYLP